jgi:hypothetical protein
MILSSQEIPVASAPQRLQETINRSADQFQNRAAGWHDHELRRLKRPVQGNMQYPSVVFPGILAVVRAPSAAIDRRRQDLDLLGQVMCIDQDFFCLPRGNSRTRPVVVARAGGSWRHSRGWFAGLRDLFLSHTSELSRFSRKPFEETATCGTREHRDPAFFHTN